MATEACCSCKVCGEPDCWTQIFDGEVTHRFGLYRPPDHETGVDGSCGRCGHREAAISEEVRRG